MKNFFSVTLYLILTYFSSVNAQCDFSFTVTNTGSNMTLFISGEALNGPLSVGDTLGVFYTNNLGQEKCGGLTVWTGNMVQIAAFGDDATTTNVKDGFAEGENIVFKAGSESNKFTVIPSPLYNYSTNGLEFISGLSYTQLDCGSNDIEGCTSALACNYNPDATVDDGSCFEPVLYYNCEGNCLFDLDLDGICDPLEIDGCTDMEATNYNENATDDDGSCEYTLSSCDLPQEFIGNTGANMTVMFAADFINSLSVQNEGAYVVAITPDGLLVGSTNVYDVNQNTIAIWGDDSLTPEVEGASTGELITFQLVDGNMLYDIFDSGIEVAVSFTTNGFQAIAISVSTELNCTSSSSADVLGCTDTDACNYNMEATLDDSSCTYTQNYYDCDGNCVSDEDADGVCDELEIEGCTDISALNYSAEATNDDGSCEYSPISCNLPQEYTGNTASNMTVMLTPTFITSLNAQNEGAYMVALSSNGDVYGSATVYGLNQNTIAIWGDDAQTSELDGAQPNELITFQLVDGNLLYNLNDGGLDLAVAFTANGIEALSSVSTELNCTSSSSDVLGCTDADACNYNVDATQDDASCTYAQNYYDCDGNCVSDVDADGICDENEILGCTDALALNYNVNATDDDGSCEYMVVVEGCTDILANNYNSEATVDDGSCLYGNGGCTYQNADNYNSDATYDDGSCIFDDYGLPFIYVTNPIDGDMITTSNVDISYTVVNVDIDLPTMAPDGGHIKYSINGGSLGSSFQQSDVISNEFEYGFHTIDFYLYTNESGNIQEWSPPVFTSVSFNVGEEGCTDSLSGNYNPNAIIDNNMCLPNANLDFEFTNTGSNHTLLILESASTIDINGLIPQEDDLIGVFYLTPSGSYVCGGSTNWSGGQNQLAAMGDDATTTTVQDGFINGQEFVWAIQFQETGNSVFLTANYQNPTMNSFTINGISFVNSFGVQNFEGVFGCTNNDYIEYNPFATIDDGSCITPKIYGCINPEFIEYWDYNDESFTISNPEITVNTDDGSCETPIIDGCVDENYLDYCTVCNVADNSQCQEIIVYGCMDDLALNYNELANMSDNSCEYDICIQLDLANFNVEYSEFSNSTVLSFDVQNLSNVVIQNPYVSIVLASDSDLQINDTSYYNSVDVSPSDALTIHNIINTDLASFPESTILNGLVVIEGETQEGTSINCSFNITEYLNLGHVGCTDPNAYNFDEQATINDGTCIDNLSASIVVNNPACIDSYANITVYVTGGTPPYSSPTEYTSYSSNGIPTTETVDINNFGVAYFNGLAVGDYVIEIQDSLEIISYYNFTIQQAEDIQADVYEIEPGLLSSVVTTGEAIFYQWLLNGSSIDGANNQFYAPDSLGYYQVYVENENGCGYYSNEIYSDYVSLLEINELALAIYPNPANSALTIELLKTNNHEKVQIVNILGNEIHSFAFDDNVGKSNTIDLAEYPSGIYLIKMYSNNQVIVKRFIKN